MVDEWSCFKYWKLSQAQNSIQIEVPFLHSVENHVEIFWHKVFKIMLTGLRSTFKKGQYKKIKGITELVRPTDGFFSLVIYLCLLQQANNCHNYLLKWIEIRVPKLEKDMNS